MVEKSPVCPSCGADLQPHSGPGRPALYCSEGCRRVIEFRVRALARRLDKYEIELREVKLGTGFYSDDDRRHRIRALKRWIAEDTAKLRALFGAKNNQKESKTPSESAESDHVVDYRMALREHARNGER